MEAELAALLDEVVERDFPFLGRATESEHSGRHQGAVVDRTYGEPIGGIRIKLTRAGREDPLFQRAGIVFRRVRRAQGGDQQAAGTRRDAGYSERCPVQAFRVGDRVYATQFHPELDLDGLATRIEVYRYAGYFNPRRLMRSWQRPEQAGSRRYPTSSQRFVELFAE